jgi:hypothetical protein
MATYKITSGSFKRNGAAIMVPAQTAQDVGNQARDGDQAQFKGKVYLIKGRGNVFTANGMAHRYLYVEEVLTTQDQGGLFLKNEPRSSGRQVRHTSGGVFCKPMCLRIEVKPRARRVMLTFFHYWFSESQGIGGESKHVVCYSYDKPGNPIHGAAQAFMDGDNLALFVLADAIDDGQAWPAGSVELREFLELAGQKDPATYVKKKHRDKVYADGCKFKVGDQVRLSFDSPVQTVVSVTFDEQMVFWRVNCLGSSFPASRYQNAKVPAPIPTTSEGGQP